MDISMTYGSKDYHRLAVIANRTKFIRFFKAIEERANLGYFSATIKDKELFFPETRERVVKTLEAFGFHISEMGYDEMVITW